MIEEMDMGADSGKILKKKRVKVEVDDCLIR
jgi:hypothetical protein